MEKNIINQEVLSRNVQTWRYSSPNSCEDGEPSTRSWLFPVISKIQWKTKEVNGDPVITRNNQFFQTSLHDIFMKNIFLKIKKF